MRYSKKRSPLAPLKKGGIGKSPFLRGIQGDLDVPHSSENCCIAINTSPLIALVAATGDLSILQSLYQEVWVSWEVGQELLAGGSTGLGIVEFEAATWLIKQTAPLEIFPLLLNSLDLGEASVIQLAINQGIQTVCIDEAVGRRVARLNGLSVTGSVGILLKAKQYSASRGNEVQSEKISLNPP